MLINHADCSPFRRKYQRSILCQKRVLGSAVTQWDQLDRLLAQGMFWCNQVLCSTLIHSSGLGPEVQQALPTVKWQNCETGKLMRWRRCRSPEFSWGDLSIWLEEIFCNDIWGPFDSIILLLETQECNQWWGQRFMSKDVHSRLFIIVKRVEPLEYPTIGGWLSKQGWLHSIQVLCFN